MLTVKIKPDKYGQAIGLLISMGAGFQTRFECTLIVNAQQRRALELAGFVAAGSAGQKWGKAVAQKRSKLERFQGYGG
jgi:hypothetical protein